MLWRILMLVKNTFHHVRNIERRLDRLEERAKIQPLRRSPRLLARVDL